jgi:hypothetical protein
LVQFVASYQSPSKGVFQNVCPQAATGSAKQIEVEARTLKTRRIDILHLLLCLRTTVGATPSQEQANRGPFAHDGPQIAVIHCRKKTCENYRGHAWKGSQRQSITDQGRPSPMR